MEQKSNETQTSSPKTSSCCEYTPSKDNNKPLLLDEMYYKINIGDNVVHCFKEGQANMDPKTIFPGRS